MPENILYLCYICLQEGMGQLRIVPGGLQLLGQALVLDSLFASSIKSRRGQPISIESSRNFTVSTRDAQGMMKSRLFLGKNIKLFMYVNNKMALALARIVY